MAGWVYAKRVRNRKGSLGLKISLEIEGASPEFERELLTLIARHREAGTFAVEDEPGWTLDRASRYMRIATADVRSLIVDVVRCDGWIGAAELRAAGRNLRTSSLSANRTVRRGIKEFLWPETIKPPLVLEYEVSATTGHRSALGYAMEDSVVSIFRQVCPDVNPVKSLRVSGREGVRSVAAPGSS